MSTKVVCFHSFHDVNQSGMFSVSYCRLGLTEKRIKSSFYSRLVLLSEGTNSTTHVVTFGFDWKTRNSKSGSCLEVRVTLKTPYSSKQACSRVHQARLSSTSTMSLWVTCRGGVRRRCGIGNRSHPRRSYLPWNVFRYHILTLTNKRNENSSWLPPPWPYFTYFRAFP